jgi:arsenate reductase (thioredoxin)
MRDERSVAGVPRAGRVARHRAAGRGGEPAAEVDGHRPDDGPVVLFLCTHNAGRSQIALGFFTRYAGQAATAWSGGSEPGSVVNPVAVAAMAERGIDISGGFPKRWTDEVVQAADMVITMGCGDTCPVFPGTTYWDWNVTDPAGQDIEQVRLIRDDIEQRVRELLAELVPGH